MFYESLSLGGGRVLVTSRWVKIMHRLPRHVMTHHVFILFLFLFETVLSEDQGGNREQNERSPKTQIENQFRK